MGNPDTRERLRTAGPFLLDGLLAVVMAAVGFALLASILPFDQGSPLAWALLIGAAFAALGLNLVALSVTILIYVVRHAGPATARAAVHHGSDRVTVEVVDDGRGGDPGRDHGGHGIAGMRERAALDGGSLEAGPRPGGGFRVAASLPVGAP